MNVETLSPQARAVLHAIAEISPAPAGEIAAAALRAALDLVVPETREHHPSTLDEKYRKVTAFNVRDQFLAIAYELETL